MMANVRYVTNVRQWSRTAAVDLFCLLNVPFQCKNLFPLPLVTVKLIRHAITYEQAMRNEQVYLTYNTMRNANWGLGSLNSQPCTGNASRIEKIRRILNCRIISANLVHITEEYLPSPVYYQFLLNPSPSISLSPSVLQRMKIFKLGERTKQFPAPRIPYC